MSIRNPIIWTLVLVILVILGLTVLNPPQCPFNYIPKNEFDCIVGANIGLPLYFVCVVPMGLVFVAKSWKKYLRAKHKNSTS